MEITSNREEMIFKKEHDGKVLYSIGLSKKKQDGSYENGYMSVRFKKDVTLEDRSKIRIKSAWLDFNKVDKKTYPYIFINEFEAIKQGEKPTTNQDNNEGAQSVDNWYAGKNIEIDENDLPFYG